MVLRGLFSAYFHKPTTLQISQARFERQSLSDVFELRGVDELVCIVVQKFLAGWKARQEKTFPKSLLRHFPVLYVSLFPQLRLALHESHPTRMDARVWLLTKLECR